MSFELITTNQEFCNIEDEWNSLYGKTDSSIFMSFDWCYAWWVNYESKLSAELTIVVERNDGHIVSILPIYRAKHGFVNGKQLWFIGTGADVGPDYLGLMSLDKESSSSKISDMLAIIPNWWMFNCRNVDQSFQAKNYIQAVQRSFSISKNIFEFSDWDEYLASFKRKRRYKTTSVINKWFNDGKGFKEIAVEKNLEAFDTLVNLHHERWKTETDEYSFKSQESIAFHRNFIEKQGSLVKFFALYDEEKIIAVYYCMSFNGKLCFFNCGINKDYDGYQPGILLLVLTIKYSIENCFTEFNFLKGDYPYKKHYSNAVDTCLDMKIFNGGKVNKLRKLAVYECKNIVKKIVKKQRSIEV